MSAEELQLIVVVAFAAVVLVIRVRTGHPPRLVRELNRRRARHGSQPRPTQILAARAWIDVAVMGVLPWLAYLAVRPSLGSDTPALAIATAVPIVWVVIRWVRIRRVERLGLVVIAAYGCAVALSASLGDAATPLKLRDAGVLAVVGLACVISVATRRPLLWLALRHLAHHRLGGEQATSRLRDPQYRHHVAGATLLIGALFLIAALIELLIMIMASTATFLAVAGPLGGLTPLAATAAAIAFLRHRSQQQRQHNS
jgi:hypothetical protein